MRKFFGMAFLGIIFFMSYAVVLMILFKHPQYQTYYAGSDKNHNTVLSGPMYVHPTTTKTRETKEAGILERFNHRPR